MHPDGAPVDPPYDGVGYRGRAPGGYPGHHDLSDVDDGYAGHGHNPAGQNQGWGQEAPSGQGAFTEQDYWEEYLRFRQAFAQEMTRRAHAAHAGGAQPFFDPRTQNPNLYAGWYAHAQTANEAMNGGHGAPRGRPDHDQAGGGRGPQGVFPPPPHWTTPEGASMQGYGGPGPNYAPPGGPPSYNQSNYPYPNGMRDPDNMKFWPWFFSYAAGCAAALPVAAMGFVFSVVSLEVFDDVGMFLVILGVMSPLVLFATMLFGAPPTVSGHFILMGMGHRSAMSYVVTGFLSWAVMGFFVSIVVKLSTQSNRMQLEDRAAEISMPGLIITSAICGMICMVVLWSQRIKRERRYYYDDRPPHHRDDGRRGGGGGGGGGGSSGPQNPSPPPQRQPDPPQKPGGTDTPFF